MFEWLTNLAHAKSLGLVIFFVTFVGIVLWVYGSKKRGQELESHKNIPFLDDESEEKGREGLLTADEDDAASARRDMKDKKL